MTLVILGTQDKTFERLLKMVEKQIENGNLKDEVIVQAGLTKYKSKYMKILDLISMKKFDELVKKADLIITHGGVGSIMNGIENNKKLIVVPRLKKYDEHENNHQLEITGEFKKLGYILSANNTKELTKALKEIENFEPKKYRSNNNKLIGIIEDYIDNL